MSLSKVFFYSLLSCFLLASCSKDSINNSEIEEFEEDIIEEITAVNLSVDVENEQLKFKDSQHFYEALDILDGINLSSRQAWESQIGFKSLRSVYEEVLEKYLNEEPINEENYRGIINFDGDYPFLINFTPYTASVLNVEGLVSVKGALGTLRVDGCFWVMSNDEKQLTSLVETKTHDPKNGLFAFINHQNEEATVALRSCGDGLGNPNSALVGSGTISNGDSRGSSSLNGFFFYNYLVVPVSSVASDTKVGISLRGESFRKGRRNWSRKRANHTFNWNFVIRHIILSASLNQIIFLTDNTHVGTETHNNNQIAIKTVIVAQGIRTNEFINRNKFILEEVFASGTSQTTNYLTPAKITYVCN